MTDLGSGPTKRPDGEVDDFAIGQGAGGKVETLTPQEYARRVALRNAEEEDEDERESQP